MAAHNRGVARMRPGGGVLVRLVGCTRPQEPVKRKMVQTLRGISMIAGIVRTVRKILEKICSVAGSYFSSEWYLSYANSVDQQKYMIGVYL